LINLGTEDLKGHVMKLRGEHVKTSRNEVEVVRIEVLQEQAAHELRYGEPRVSDSITFGN
jgi:hypothetical protein